jgi:hypothetical protein
MIKVLSRNRIITEEKAATHNPVHDVDDGNLLVAKQFRTR